MTVYLKPYQILLVIVSWIICFITILGYGWIGYATLTDRPGINGHWYIMYNLSKGKYSLWIMSLTIFGLGLFVYQLYCIMTKSKKRLLKSFWGLAVLVLIMIVFEIYLSSIYVGKG